MKYINDLCCWNSYAFYLFDEIYVRMLSWNWCRIIQIQVRLSSRFCNVDVLFSINIDENNEEDIQIAVEEGEKLLKIEECEVVVFTSHADQSTIPGHYVMFMGNQVVQMLKKCAACLDMCLLDVAYLLSRKLDEIRVLELRVLVLLCT